MMVRDDIVEAIDRYFEQHHRDLPRPHLGASVMGKECMRAVWYGFRWAAHESPPGRILRLFQRGHAEEDMIVDRLRKIGARVLTVDPSTGKQFSYRRHHGHMGGSQDAALTNVPGCPQTTWYLGEFKTHKLDSFEVLAGKIEKGVAVGGVGVRIAKPEHYAQAQLYMHWSGLRKCLYVAACKDNDRIYIEEFDYDEEFARDAEARGEAIIFMEEPPPKMIGARDASFFKCKFCPAIDLCHGDGRANVNCRTCAHATAERDGDARWSCALHKRDLSVDEQRAGCANHVYHPSFMVNLGEYVGGDETSNYAEYRTKDGTVLRNGTACRDEGAVPVYSSAELRVMPDMAAARVLDPLRARVGGEFVQPTELSERDKRANEQMRTSPSSFRGVKAPKAKPWK